MEEQMKSINVEEIMAEIRMNIEKRGETPDILDFDEAEADKVCAGGFKGSVRYDENVLHQALSRANEEHNIPYYQMIPAGGLKSFVKRSIRKVIAFIVLPLRDAQNRYNAYTVETMMQLEACTLMQQEMLKKQEEDLEKMTERLQKLEKKCEQLLSERENGEM